MLKAWVVWCGDDWCTLIHGETRGKAQAFVMGHIGVGDFIDYSALRLPGLDGKPITFDNAAAAGFHYLDESTGDDEDASEFRNWCKCEVCE